MKQNPQLRNVGNLGDILKHAALMNLAKMLIGRRRSRFAYIETHAFMLEATCPNPAQWEQETQAVVTGHAAYSDYHTAERRVLDNLPYRCSAGLVIDELKKSNAIDPVIFVAEKDEATRNILKEQLLEEKITNCTVLNDALQLDAINLPDDVQTLLILVDPFKLDAELWNGIVAALNKIIRPGLDVVLELFTYDKEQSSIYWPSPPVGMIGPISVMHRQPYHLAVYATDTLKKDTNRTCQRLGWQTRRETRRTPESLLNIICDGKNYNIAFPGGLILYWAKTDLTSVANFMAMFFEKVFRELDVNTSGLDVKRHGIRDIPSSFNHRHYSWNLDALIKFCKVLSKNPELIKQIRNHPSYPQGSEEDLYIFEGQPTKRQIARIKGEEKRREEEKERKQKYIADKKAKVEYRKKVSARLHRERQAFLQQPLIDQVCIFAIDETRPVKIFPIDPNVITFDVLKDLNRTTLGKLSTRISVYRRTPWRDLAQRIDQIQNRE